MSKRSTATKSDKGSAAPAATPPPAPVPLAPRPLLFKVLLAGFAVWLIVLLTLYFKTVYPMRYPSTPPTATSHS